MRVKSNGQVVRIANDMLEHPLAQICELFKVPAYVLEDPETALVDKKQQNPIVDIFRSGKKVPSTALTFSSGKLIEITILDIRHVDAVKPFVVVAIVDSVPDEDTGKRERFLGFLVYYD